MDTYFIGYDAREHEAAAVCAFSLMRRKMRPSQVIFLEHRELRRLGYFTRPWSLDTAGQFRDARDGRPFSTEFSHSRFLVFHLANVLGLTGPCMFLDCDFVFIDSPTTMMQAQQINRDAIGVVMRDRAITTATKMDGMAQEAYTRKLWSALFTFMPRVDLAELFAPEEVNTESGRRLHAFLDLPDDSFWPIDPAWHVIPSLDGDMETEDGRRASALHFSEWSPWLNPAKMKDSPRSFQFWHLERRDWLRHASATGETLDATPLSRLIES